MLLALVVPNTIYGIGKGARGKLFEISGAGWLAGWQNGGKERNCQVTLINVYNRD